MSDTSSQSTVRDHHARRLYDALRARRTNPPLIEDDPKLTIDDAYAISLATLALRTADGERVVGKKIGVTSKAVQDMLGVHQPDFGFLTDRMWIEGDIDIAATGLIQPRAEAEIAFILRDGLKGPGVTAEQVIAATRASRRVSRSSTAVSGTGKSASSIRSPTTPRAAYSLLVKHGFRRRAWTCRTFMSRSPRTVSRSARVTVRRCRARPPKPWLGSPTPLAHMVSPSTPATLFFPDRWCPWRRRWLAIYLRWNCTGSGDVPPGLSRRRISGQG